MYLAKGESLLPPCPLESGRPPWLGVTLARSPASLLTRNPRWLVGREDPPSLSVSSGGGAGSPLIFQIPQGGLPPDQEEAG